MYITVYSKMFIENPAWTYVTKKNNRTFFKIYCILYTLTKTFSHIVNFESTKWVKMQNLYDMTVKCIKILSHFYFNLLLISNVLSITNYGGNEGLIFLWSLKIRYVRVLQ